MSLGLNELIERITEQEPVLPNAVQITDIEWRIYASIN